MGIPFDPYSLYSDVSGAIRHVHVSGILHNAVSTNPSKYLHESPDLRPLLEHFHSSGKKLFLLTNSSYSFVNAGLSYIMGGEHSDWRSLFDIIITDARKPKFYTSQVPFRSLDSGESFVKWNTVTTSTKEIEKGRILIGGSMSELMKLAGWDDSGNMSHDATEETPTTTTTTTKKTNVLYFGDHLETDLVEPRRNLGFYTGAIIHELDKEIQVYQSNAFQNLKLQADTICDLIRNIQQALLQQQREQSNGEDTSMAETNTKQLLDLLEEEYSLLLTKRGNLFNENFGSIFRTRGEPSSYSFALYRNVDLYTTAIENFIHYPNEYRFYPRKTDHLPHEQNQQTVTK